MAYIFSATIVTGILEKLHKGQTQMNHRTQYIHKHIDRMSDNEYQHHHNRSGNHIVGAHTHSQTVEYSCKDTSRQTEGKQRTYESTSPNL